MTSIGTGYDLSSSTYSPDGRIFQVEYASKAVDNSSTALGIRCKDGVVLALEKFVTSKLINKRHNRRILTVERHSGVLTTGLQADGRQLGIRARVEAQSWRKNYRETIPTECLAENMAMFVQAYTLYSSVRPFGCSAIVGALDPNNGPGLYMIEPSGEYSGFRAVAIGKGKQLAKTELEKLNFDEIDCRQAVKDVVRILGLVHDDAKDKEVELEITWVCRESNGLHQHVPLDLLREAESYSRQMNQPDEEMDG